MLRTIMTDRRATGRDQTPASPTPADRRAGMTSNFTPDEYRQAVARCVDYIAAGDIFQVNLSQRFEARDAPDPRATYRALRGLNPASYSAFLEFEAAGGGLCAILSSSPELFLRVRGRRVVTRPIKGTRGRSGDPAVDADARADLLASPKDNAELAMIVDLLRNDLGRVCEYGSIRVTEPATLEEHPTVYHLVATVAGELREGVGQAELLRATFPGGSITGAPKIRAMEIIDELEPVARGRVHGLHRHRRGRRRLRVEHRHPHDHPRRRARAGPGGRRDRGRLPPRRRVRGNAAQGPGPDRGRRTGTPVTYNCMMNGWEQPKR